MQLADLKDEIMMITRAKTNLPEQFITVINSKFLQKWIICWKIFFGNGNEWISHIYTNLKINNFNKTIKSRKKYQKYWHMSEMIRRWKSFDITLFVKYVYNKNWKWYIWHYCRLHHVTFGDTIIDTMSHFIQNYVVIFGNSWEFWKIVQFFCIKSYYLLLLKVIQHISKEIYIWSRFILCFSLYLQFSTLFVNKSVASVFLFNFLMLDSIAIKS